MRFLIDENVGLSITKFLQKEGYDIVFVGTSELRNRQDEYLLRFSFQNKRVVITNDKDFGYIVFRKKIKCFGIILFRLSKESPSLKIEKLKFILSNFSNKIVNHFIVITDNKIRIRKLY
jgi:predicted nuclease of predicted toxin-antitoxin system